VNPISTLVDRGLAIMAAQKELAAELKQIAGELEQHGLAHAREHEPLADVTRTGRRWFARGTAAAVPLIFTADKLLGSFDVASPQRSAIEAAAGVHFDAFFKPVSGFEALHKDGQTFRLRAQNLLGDRAPAFLTACLARDKNGLAKSDFKILWTDAQPLVVDPV
jgi:hypothetical protein